MIRGASVNLNASTGLGSREELIKPVVIPPCRANRTWSLSLASKSPSFAFRERDSAKLPPSPTVVAQSIHPGTRTPFGNRLMAALREKDTLGPTPLILPFLTATPPGKIP